MLEMINNHNVHYTTVDIGLDHLSLSFGNKKVSLAREPTSGWYSRKSFAPHFIEACYNTDGATPPCLNFVFDYTG